MSLTLGWLGQYTYAGVLLAATVDAMALPFPGRLVLLAAGVLAAAGHLHLLGTVGVGVVGAMAGDHLWYFGGRLARGRLQALYRWVAGRWDGSEAEAVDYLRRHGGVTIIIGRFIATVRVLVWPIASAHGIAYRRFLLWDLCAATLWAGAFVLVGYGVGRPALDLMDRVGGPALIAAGVGVSLLAGGVLLWRRRRAPAGGRAGRTDRRRARPG